MSDKYEHQELHNGNNIEENTDKPMEITKEQIDKLIEQIENDLGKDI